MTVKRFFGESARDALRKVKEALGPEAIVISNKAVPGGVEITAMSADSLDALSRQGAPSPAPAVPAAAAKPAGAVPATGHFIPPAPTFATHGGIPDEDDYTVSLSTKARAPQPFQSWQPWPQPEPVRQNIAPVSDEKVKLRPLPPKPAAAPGHDRLPDLSATVDHAARNSGLANLNGGIESGVQVQQLMAEMQSIRGMLERQLAGFAWGDMTRHAPAKAQLLGEMLEAGFSGLLARRLVEDMPDDLELQDGRKWLVGAVNRRLRTLTSENDLIDRGGVFALVGPTGVGKTTTTAKLAARCVVRYGADKLALLTTDGYRIGAHEQLRIYGRILGVPVHVVRDSEDLRRTLTELRGKHMVLIDTVGMSQRDRMVAEQAAMLMRAGEVRRLLMLNATSRGDTLDDVIRSYAGEDLAGCILTKVDETASLAPAIDAVVRHGLLLSYVANGQRVPEDLHLPNRNYLLHRAFKQPKAESAHRLKAEEVGLIMPSRAETVLAAAPRGAALV
ncbi:MAG: flagellar biosynthesis protein FlhF [Gammaproteobacteria bacterium]|nr:flagellar biosynthesis protein FlhF [Gammaproteobacteria bacterium]